MKRGGDAGSGAASLRGRWRRWRWAIAAAALALTGIGWAAWKLTSERGGPDSATRRMAAILAQRAAAVDPLQVEFPVNDRRAAALAREIERTQDELQRLSIRSRHALELLNAGNISESLHAIDVVRAEAQRLLSPQEWASARLEALILEAVAGLRLAEQENCCARSTPDSCLVPIRDRGIHERTEGSQRAIRVLGQVLAEQPGHLLARWLFNIAHMTLGTYPNGVPQEHLIHPKFFAPEYPLQRFQNVAAQAGLDVYGHAGGAVLDDLDNDGLLDLVTSAVGFDDPMRLFCSLGTGRFEERSRQAGILGETSGFNLIHADYDNDGWLDVLVLRGGWMGSQGRLPLSLLKNSGNRTFSDVTEAAGLLRFAPSQTAVWFDYDGDGWLDIFVGNESSRGNIHPCHLFRNDGRGRFTDVAKSVGVDYVGYVKGVVSGDYDNDGRPDLYLSVLNADNVLFRNEGPVGVEGSERAWKFADAAPRAGVVEPYASFGCFFFDYDNDGRLDLFVVGYGSATGYGRKMADAVAADYMGLETAAERGRLFRNRGDGTFEDVTRAARLYRVVPGMGLNFGDLDNDGFLDFYVGTGNPHLSSLVPNRMFRNAEGRFFQDVTSAGNFGHLQKGHAICFADIDNDGDQDIFAQMGGAYTSDRAFSTLYENPGNGNGWIALVLKGTVSNRCAIGARVRVAVETPNGPRTIHRVVGSGGSFGSSTLRQEIGLGEASRISQVEVTWPRTGKTDRFEGLELREAYRIIEGDPKAVRIERPKFGLSRTSGAGGGPRS